MKSNSKVPLFKWQRSAAKEMRFYRSSAIFVMLSKPEKFHRAVNGGASAAQRDLEHWLRAKEANTLFDQGEEPGLLLKKAKKVIGGILLQRIVSEYGHGGPEAAH